MQIRSSKSQIKFRQSQDALSIPSSYRSTVRQNTREIAQDINFKKEQMKNIRQKMFIKKVIKQLQSLISPQKSPPDIVEEWETNEESENTRNIYEQQKFQDKIIRFYPQMRISSILQGISLVSFIWSTTIAITFQEQLFTPLFLALIGVQIICIILKILLLNIDDRLFESQFIFKVKRVLSPSLILVGSAMMILRNQVEYTTITIPIDMVMLFFCIFLARKVPSYFKAIKHYAQNKKIIKELRITELFCVLFVIAHFFALIMYASIYLCPEGEPNWLNGNSKNLQHRGWHTKYIYALYWAITTIVTVGYGDLTPQNQAEVIVMMILQICGTSFFGYMINVIGITVDNINKKNEEYDNYQQTISKLKDHYQLSEELSTQMKKDIENKYNEEGKTASLKKNQEMDFLEYVDSTVKKNFILQTNIRIIKKSIFFLTYFTVNFQNYIALKLIRIIYKKDENIETYDPIARQRNIIIVNHGKVNLYIEKRQNNVVKNKLVRTIQPIQGKPTLNVIGYSSLILNQDIDIFASANQMTSGYVLRMSDVMESIEKSMVDYQNFHQMRQKMLLISMKQAIQAPSLKDTSYHFTPNIFILICKYKKKSQQNRKKVQRQRRRGFKVLDKVKTEVLKDGYTVHQELQEELYSKQYEATTKPMKKIDEFQSLLSVEGEPVFEETLAVTTLSKPEEKYLRVDQVKIFQHYMKHHNVNTVATNYEKACEVKEVSWKRFRTNLLQKNKIDGTKQLKKNRSSTRIKSLNKKRV